MLRWALIFFIISLVAAVFGFAGIASAAAEMMKNIRAHRNMSLHPLIFH